MSKFVDLAQKLANIPHLYLRSFDVHQLQSELNSIDPALFVARFAGS